MRHRFGGGETDSSGNNPSPPSSTYLRTYPDRRSAPWKKQAPTMHEHGRDEMCPYPDTESQSGRRWQTSIDPPNTIYGSPAATVQTQMRRGTWQLVEK
ncbi:hypothetical protein LX32DRAFT_641828 [Colletotrichum zoysiae]|uniref:Uncharacterized protein n=1 Tax=Colletotrichum zoysiae TaxID=1216348 RepID=A0AAD9LXY1_9PEZI|nr:hypothetical protein LX32DRAFT_641828 [Colletotrichum zoysiae]